MDSATKSYLEGRFSDYYRSVDLPLPEDADNREWAVIPWQTGHGSRMYRHMSLVIEGGIDAFLKQHKPRHLYYSGAVYDNPDIGNMDDKGRRYADLLFDIDFDHLPQYEGGTDASLQEVLETSQQELITLVEILEDDFGFEDFVIKFSGNRGFHVHVQDEEARALDARARDEIIKYMRSEHFDYYENYRRHEDKNTSSGTLRATSRLLPFSTGLQRRIYETAHEYVTATQEEMGSSPLDMASVFEDEEVSEAVYERTIEAALKHLNTGYLPDEADTPGAKLAMQAISVATEAESAHIDESVTSDVVRLIRAQGSLHGGRGLVVKQIDRDEIEDFDPLVDAIPERFTKYDVDLTVTEPTEFTLNNETFDLEKGEYTLPEYAAISLMCQGIGSR